MLSFDLIIRCHKLGLKTRSLPIFSVVFANPSNACADSPDRIYLTFLHVHTSFLGGLVVRLLNQTYDDQTTDRWRLDVEPFRHGVLHKEAVIPLYL